MSLKKSVSFISIVTLFVVFLSICSFFSLNGTAFSFNEVFASVSMPNNSVSSAELPRVFVGGTPISIAVKNQGIIVVGRNDVITENGAVNTLKNSDIRTGDVIVEINGVAVDTQNDIVNSVNDDKMSEKTVSVKLIREGREVVTELEPALDKYSNRYRTGLWVRDETLGIGTLTYIEADTLKYGALGHYVIDPDTKQAVRISDGTIGQCHISGAQKGSRGEAGALYGCFVNAAEPLGNILKNENIGIFGNVFAKDGLDMMKNNIYAQPVEVAEKTEVRPGRATIISTVDENGVEEFDIDIIKVSYQSKSSERGMVIRVTDERLIKKTGGIVQGMSGSPIIQNGKLVGAVTHVFLNDATRGYAVFAENMLNVGL